MAEINSACHALIADVAAADRAEATAAQAQATATQGAVHQIGQSVKYEETAEADLELCHCLAALEQAVPLVCE